MEIVPAEAWKSFQRVVAEYLGNTRSPDYEEIVADLLKNYKRMGKF